MVQKRGSVGKTSPEKLVYFLGHQKLLRLCCTVVLSENSVSEFEKRKEDGSI